MAMGVHDGNNHNSSSSVAACLSAQILQGVANCGLEADRLVACLSSVAGPLVYSSAGRVTTLIVFTMFIFMRGRRECPAQHGN